MGVVVTNFYARKRAIERNAKRAKDREKVGLSASMAMMIAAKLDELPDEAEKRRFLAGLLDKGYISDAGHAQALRAFSL